MPSAERCTKKDIYNTAYYTMTKNILNIKTIALLFLLMLTACGGHPDVPTNCTNSNEHPAISPDYVDVTIPSNIAPLNFMLTDSTYTDCVARFTVGKGVTQTYGNGNKVLIDEGEWNDMLAFAKGGTIKVEVFGKKADGSWVAFKDFHINVAKEEVDPYISYRLIEPSYVMYDDMNISQRNVTSFDESEIFNNKITWDQKKGQCINCHSYQNYHTDNMLFHVRFTHGATVLVNDGKAQAVNLKRSNTISAGVYPSWHPTEKLIAFSTNKTAQLFHTANKNKVEVFDDASDLILYDIKNDKVLPVCSDTMRLEVFPTWSPDGKWLYYCSAADSIKGSGIKDAYTKLHYSIYRKSFDAKTLSFGEEELVYDAASKGRSSSLPRISPDGKYMVFAEGSYGCFNIWHNDADIVMIDLKTGGIVDTKAMNSKRAESYPSFSSNGKWVMCASRRDDGNYSRVYMAYFDGKRTHKAFLLPQSDPEHNTLRLKSYNRPEFMVEPVKISMKEFARLVEKQ